ncbi:hypothetical protein KP190043_p610 (plasmid) [Klebsiella pneumoniae subsp. pneumoniae]|jgi:hypothetical protein
MTMKPGFTAILITLALSGCSIQSPKPSWITSSQKDQFTDKTSCTIQLAKYYTRTSAYTQTGEYYPFISMVDNQLRVGVRSGGRALIPVGDVQLRIDSNPAWNITTAETPIDSSAATNYQLPSYTNLTSEQQALIAETQKSAMASITKTMSPYTATTGDKAQKIIQQLISGNKLIYRTVGLNQTGSTTGEYDLASMKESLIAGLNQCGIKY